MTRATLKKRPQKGATFAEIAIDARQFFAERGIALAHGHKRAAFELYADAFNSRARRLLPSVYDDWPRLDYDTLRKAWAAFEKDGAAALSDRRTGDHNRERGHFKAHPDQARIAESLIVRNRKMQESDEWLHKLLVEALMQANIVPLPSLKQTRAFRRAYLAEHERELFALRAPDRAKGSMRPAVGDMAAKVARPNELVELDFTPANVLCRDGKRYAIASAVDVFTRRRVDVVVDSESSDAVAEVLKRYIAEHGVPEAIRVDNGKGFVSKRILLGCRAFNIDVHIAPPYSGDQKPFVERAHRTLSDQLFPLLDSHIGRNVAERQAIREEVTFDQRGREKQKLTANGLGRVELQQVIDAWSVTYHNEVHRGIGCTPNDMAARHIGKWSRLHPAQIPLLGLHFARPAGRGVATVGKEGLRIEGRDYSAPELARPRLSGSRVAVREHPTDAGRVLVFEDDDRFLCVALNPELAGIDRAEWAAKCRAAYEGSLKLLRQKQRELKKTGPDVQRLAMDHFQRRASQFSNVTVLAAVSSHDAPGMTGAQQAHEAMQVQSAEAAASTSARSPVAIDFDSGAWRTFRDDEDRFAFWSALHERIGSGASLHPKFRQWHDVNADLFGPQYEQLREFDQRAATGTDGPKSRFG